MKTFAKVKKILSEHKALIREKFNVKEIAVFGSYVRSENKNVSDIDILVEFSQPVGFFAFLDLEEYLAQLLGIKVDLVTKKALKPYIGKQILQEAITIL